MVDSDAHAVESASQEPIGGRYKIQRVLGRGGMATVYLCEDTQNAGLVAVKVLRQEIGSAVVVERFLREIEFASRLDHPRIPRVLDSSTTADGTPFYVMTYIEGESLRELLDRVKQLPIEQALAITSAVMEPMTYAHRMGIVHRDIKPGNIIIGVDGVHVLDFGIARAIVASAEDRLTSTGIAIGTPAYMSPEQALGDHDLDARSDIYTLGCVVYEMIAGIPPFVGATPQAAMARRFAAVASPLSETRDGVPAHVVRAVAKALNRAPADRWQTVREFGDALAASPMPESEQAVKRHIDERRVWYIRGLLVTTATAIIAAGSFAAAGYRIKETPHGQEALGSWDFAKAEKELRRAIDRDRGDARSLVWLAQVMMLRGAPEIEWRALVLESLANRSQLDSLNRLRASALGQLADPRSRNRCDLLERLARSAHSNKVEDFTASLAYADCLRLNASVVPDSASPSGFRFQSSYHRAALEYEALVLRNLEEDRAYQVLIPRLESVLATNKNVLRGGVEPGGSDIQFVAHPSLAGDTIAYYPYPLRGGGAAAREMDPANLERLVSRNRHRLTALSTSWAERHPWNPEAHESLARTLEASAKLDGPGASALKHVRLARSALPKARLGADTEYLQAVRLASAEARLLVKLNRFDEAAQIARSALSYTVPPGVVDSMKRESDYALVGLAALTGQLQRVLEIELKYASDYPVRLRSGEVRMLPPELAADAIRLDNYAAFGGPKDSIHRVTTTLASKLTALVPASVEKDMLAAVLRRPLSLAAPVIGSSPVSSLGESSDLFSQAIRAIDAKAMGRAAMFADSLSALHAGRAPGEVTMDITLQEAWLQVRLGRSKSAIRTLDNALHGLSRAPPNLLGSATMPAALVRVMLLRAELGSDSISSSWKRSAHLLWERGDSTAVKLLNQRVVREASQY